MQQEDKTEKVACDNCRTPIDLGQDLITTEQCVHGPRGIVPLGKITTFCSERCVRKWFGDDPVERLPDVAFRIP